MNSEYDMTQYLNIDMQPFYDFVTTTFMSLWPIIVPAVAIGLVVMLVSGIMFIIKSIRGY